VLAAFAARVGGDDPLANLEVGEQPRPTPRPGWALVRLHAAALNHHDIWSLRGVSARPITPPLILGCDGAGTLEDYGEGTSLEGLPEGGARVLLYPVVTCGRCVACLSDEPEACRSSSLLSEPPLHGTLAEFVVVPAVNLVPLPETVGFAEASCLPTAYLTAYHMLFSRAGLRPGQSVLVQGAAGGVATASILLGRLGGLTVYATSRSEEKRQVALDLGAEAAFPPVRETARELVAATGGLGVDAVIETVGEPTWELSLRSVRPGGTVVVSGATGGAEPPAPLRRIFFRRITIAGSTMGTRGELRRMVELMTTGALRPLIGATHELADVRAGFAEMARGEVRGKIVITI
jgi:NADPH:quinone reductase-like Zn-dependent oxidoreductase